MSYTIFKNYLNIKKISNLKYTRRMNTIILKEKLLNYGLLTKDFIGGAAKCFTSSFQREPMVKALEIPVGGFYSFAEKICEKAYLEQKAYIVVEPTSQKVVGVCIIQDALEDEEPIEDIDQGLEVIFSLLASLQERYINENQLITKGEVAMAFSLSIDQDFEGVGMAYFILGEALNQARNLGYKKIITEATSVVSQNLVKERYDFKPLFEIRYKDFVYKGEKIFEKFPEGSNPTCVLMEKVL